MPSVSIIIPVFNQWKMLKNCVDSILDKTESDYQIILINDNSDEETTAFCQELYKSGKVRKLLYNRPTLGFSKSVNQGIAISGDFDWMCLLNSDTIIATNHWLTEIMICGNSDDKTGVVGVISNCATHQSIGKAVVDEDDIQKYGKYIIASLGQKHPQVDLVNGFCYFIKSKIQRQVGLFDDINFPHYGSEDDYSLQVKQKGFKSVIADNVYVYHYGSQSYGRKRKSEICQHAIDDLDKKWGKALDAARTETVKTLSYLKEIK